MTSIIEGNELTASTIIGGLGENPYENELSLKAYGISQTKFSYVSYDIIDKFMENIRY